MFTSPFILLKHFSTYFQKNIWKYITLFPLLLLPQGLLVYQDSSFYLIFSFHFLRNIWKLIIFCLLFLLSHGSFLSFRGEPHLIKPPWNGYRCSRRWSDIISPTARTPYSYWTFPSRASRLNPPHITPDTSFSVLFSWKLFSAWSYEQCARVVKK